MKTDIYQQFIETRKKEALYRTLNTDKNNTDNAVINFASNDYLGLSQNIDVLQAGYDTAKKYGVGSYSIHSG